MKKIDFPYLASGLGLFFMLVVIIGSQANSDGISPVPLLTLLVLSEFAFFITAAGAYIGIQHIRSIGIKPLYTIATTLCLLLSLRFILLGIELWPL